MLLKKTNVTFMIWSFTYIYYIFFFSFLYNQINREKINFFFLTFSLNLKNIKSNYFLSIFSCLHFFCIFFSAVQRFYYRSILSKWHTHLWDRLFHIWSPLIGVGWRSLWIFYFQGKNKRKGHIKRAFCLFSPIWSLLK